MPGIGSQYKALKNIAKSKNWKIIHTGMIEWYIDAIIAYIAIHDKTFVPKIEHLKSKYKISHDSKNLISDFYFKKINNSIKASYINYSKNKFNNLFDITNITHEMIPPNIDIFTYSFPCQDLSVQGLQKGIDKSFKTRSGLLWEVERILTECKESFKITEMPKYLLMENVKNLIGKNNIKNYNLWIKKLYELGYSSKTYLLNSKDFESPQNRERIFCISIRNDYKEKVKYNFPIFEKSNNKIVLNDILEKNITKYIDLSKYASTNYFYTKTGIIKKTLKNYSNFNSENYIYFYLGIGPTLTASGANSRIKIELHNNKIRYMSAMESYLYMGFEKEDYFLVKKTNLLSETKIIYTAGNSISIKVLETIFNSFIFKE